MFKPLIDVPRVEMKPPSGPRSASDSILGYTLWIGPLVILLGLTQLGLDWFSTQIGTPRGQIVFCIAVALVGRFMFWLRENYLVSYARLELGVALLFSWGTAGSIKTVGELTTFLGFAASVFLVVRGLDNLKKGKDEEEAAKEKLDRARDDMQRLEWEALRPAREAAAKAREARLVAEWKKRQSTQNL